MVENAKQGSPESDHHRKRSSYSVGYPGKFMRPVQSATGAMLPVGLEVRVLTTPWPLLGCEPLPIAVETTPPGTGNLDPSLSLYLYPR